MTAKLNRTHFERQAFVYVRQSTVMQVHEHVESKQRQYALVERAATLGWSRGNIEVIDEDQGKSGATSEGRTGFARVKDKLVQSWPSKSHGYRDHRWTGSVCSRCAPSRA